MTNIWNASRLQIVCFFEMLDICALPIPRLTLSKTTAYTLYHLLLLVKECVFNFTQTWYIFKIRHSLIEQQAQHYED